MLPRAFAPIALAAASGAAVAVATAVAAALLPAGLDATVHQERDAFATRPASVDASASPGEATAPAPAPPDTTMPADSLVVRGAVGAGGTLDATVRFRIATGQARIIRRLLARGGRRDEEQLCASLAQQMGLPGPVADVKVGGGEAAGDPLVVSFSVRREGYVDTGRARQDLPLPLPGVPLASGPGGAQQEGGPLFLGTPRTVVQRVILDLPPGFGYIPSVPREEEHDFAAFRVEVAQNAGTVDVRRILEVREGVLERSREEEYRSLARIASGPPPEITLARADTGDGAVAAGGAGAEAVPDDPRALARAGSAAKNAGDHARAVRLLERAVRLRPDHPTAWKLLGSSYLALDRPAEAERAFRRQIQVDPELQHAWASLAAALDAQGRASEAEEAFRRQLALAPDDPYAHAGLASLLVEGGRIAEAGPHLDRVAELELPDADVKTTAAWALAHAGRLHDARALLEAVVEADSSRVDGRHLLGWTLRKSGARARALPHLRAAVEARPGDPDYRLDLARALWERGDDEEALAVLREGVERNPRHPGLRQALAHVLSRLGRTEEARRQAERARELRGGGTEGRSRRRTARRPGRRPPDPPAGLPGPVDRPEPFLLLPCAVSLMVPVSVGDDEFLLWGAQPWERRPSRSTSGSRRSWPRGWTAT